MNAIVCETSVTKKRETQSVYISTKDEYYVLRSHDFPVAQLFIQLRRDYSS